MKTILTRRATRRSLSALVLVASIVGLVTLGFVTVASAATTIGKAQSSIGGDCHFGEGSVVQSGSSGTSYTVPSAGTLTDWSVQEGDVAATVSLEVWHPDGGGLYSVVFRSPSIFIPAGSAFHTTPLSPAASVNAGDVLGLHFTTVDAPCFVFTGNAGDTWGGFFGATPLNTPTPIFDFSVFLNAQINVAATFVPAPAVRFVAGNTQSVNPNSSISATVGADGVAAGDTVVVSVATGTFGGGVSCSDTEGNSYSVVADKNTGSGRLFLCKSTLATPLATGDKVTATYPGFSGRSVISVDAISSSATTGVLDGTPATSSGSNPPISVGPITTTNSTGDVLFAAVAHSSPSTFTAGAGYTVVGEVTGGTGAGQRTVSPMFQIVSSPGTYTATGSLSGSGFWQAALVGLASP